MSRKKTRTQSGRLTWQRLLGGLLAACLLLLLTVALRQGAVENLLKDVLPDGWLEGPPEQEAGLALHMIDVGQAQALLLTCGGEAALVDTGLPETEDQVVAYLRKAGVRKLKQVFVTHPHSDHCGGTRDVLQRIGAEVLVVPEYLSEEATLATAGDWVGTTNTQIDITHTGRGYTLGEAVITVLHPAADNGIDEVNDLSLVLRVAYGGKTLLLTGDITEAAEAQLTGIGPVDVLQVPHHGSYTSSSRDFLEALRPDYALISCGRNNDYGHPHDSVVERLEAVGAAIFRTDRDGTVVVRVNEGQITVKIENGS